MTTEKKKLKHSAEEALQMRDLAVTALEDAKAEDVQVLDVTNLTDVTDYMIVASGNSDRHVSAITEQLVKAMQQNQWQALNVEGQPDKEWIVADFVDIVVHVMRHQTRARYNLEGLWDQTFSNIENDRTD